MSTPLVSAIIPTYNRREWVQQAIDSVLAQRGVSVECIVVDDGSTDGTGDALLRHYGERIQYLYQDNAGESAARNRGASEARGEFLAFLDSDDLWMPHKLLRQVAYLQVHSQCGAVYCRAYAMNEAGRPLLRLPYGASIPGPALDLRYALERGIALSGSSMLARAEVFHALSGFVTDIRHGEDVEILYRMLLEGIAVHILPRPLAWVRSHTHSQSLTLQQERFEAAYRDHMSIFDRVAARSSDPSVQRAVQGARQKEALRRVSFAIYARRPDLVADYRQHPLLASTIPAPAFDRQAQYFTPLIYRESADPRRVLEFLARLFAYRDSQSPVSGRRRADALARLSAAIWCAGQHPRHAVFAWAQLWREIFRQPGLLLAPGMWKLVARLLFGRLAIRLYLLWSHARD